MGRRGDCVALAGEEGVVGAAADGPASGRIVAIQQKRVEVQNERFGGRRPARRDARPLVLRQFRRLALHYIFTRLKGSCRIITTLSDRSTNSNGRASRTDQLGGLER